jgi:hypothetical protein
MTAFPGFEIELTEPPGTTKLFRADSPATLPVADDAPAGVYRVRVRQVGDDDRTIPGPWSTAQEIQKRPGPPTLDTLTLVDGWKVHLVWSGIDLPGFEVEVAFPWGEVKGIFAALSPTEIPLWALADAPVDQCDFRVRAIGYWGSPSSMIPGAWSPSKKIEPIILQPPGSPNTSDR